MTEELRRRRQAPPTIPLRRRRQAPPTIPLRRRRQAPPTIPRPWSILIAGVGNAWLRDDGFGGEVARRLTERSCPPAST